MISYNVTYREDHYTLQCMTEYLEFPEKVIRKIQKLGLMLPEIVKFGSREIEIYSELDITMFRLFMEILDECGDFSKAAGEAGAYVSEMYRVAHGDAPPPMNGPSESGQVALDQRRKKLFLKHELRETLGIGQDQFQEVLHTYGLAAPVMLRIPGQKIEYYLEEDYLSLRYVVTLLGQGHSLELAVEKAFDWHTSDLRGDRGLCNPRTCALLKEGAATEKSNRLSSPIDLRQRRDPGRNGSGSTSTAKET